MRAITSLGLCALVAAAVTGCSDSAGPASPQPVSTPTSQPEVTNSASDQSGLDQTERDAQLLAAITESPLAGKITSHAWNDALMQVGIHADNTGRDQMRLCTELAGRFGDGYGLNQILVITRPVTYDPITPGEVSAPDPVLPIVAWISRTHTCTRESGT